MSSTTAGWLQFALLVVALAACYVPLGNYIARIFTSDKDWAVERGFYKLIGIDRTADQKWSTYLRSILAVSFVSVLFLYGIQRLQTTGGLAPSSGCDATTVGAVARVPYTAVYFMYRTRGGDNTSRQCR